MSISPQHIRDRTAARRRISELRIAIIKHVAIARNANSELVKLKRMHVAYSNGGAGELIDGPLDRVKSVRKAHMAAARELAHSIRTIRKEHNMQQVTETAGLKPFTVLCSQALGRSSMEVYFAHVMAPDHKEATVLGVAEAANNYEEDADDIDALGVFEGHISPVDWADGGLDVDRSRFSKRQVTVLPKV